MFHKVLGEFRPFLRQLFPPPGIAKNHLGFIQQVLEVGLLSVSKSKRGHYFLNRRGVFVSDFEEGPINMLLIGPVVLEGDEHFFNKKREQRRVINI